MLEIYIDYTLLGLSIILFFKYLFGYRDFLSDFLIEKGYFPVKVMLFHIVLSAILYYLDGWVVHLIDVWNSSISIFTLGFNGWMLTVLGLLIFSCYYGFYFLLLDKTCHKEGEKRTAWFGNSDFSDMTFTLTTGQCPSCYKKISRLSKRCPYCTTKIV